MFEAERLTIGAFLKIKTGEDAGLYKLTSVTKLTDGENEFFRCEADMDTGKEGDEIYIEYFYQFPREITILHRFDSFLRKNAESWPPPREIDIVYKGEKIHFKSFNTDSGEHAPLIAKYTYSSSKSKFGESRIPDVCASSVSIYNPGAMAPLKKRIIVIDDKLQHWEYQDETAKRFLSIYLIDGNITMNIGYVTSIGFVDLI